jgi:hypothetical protein
MLTTNKLKVTMVLKAEELLAVSASEGQARTVLRVKTADGRAVSADIATKSLRKAQTTARELGADGVALILQGSLAANDVLVEAGLVAQPRVKKEAA